MKKKNNNKEKKYVIKYNYEDSFISDVKNISNCYSRSDIEGQKDAIKNIIKYIKIEKEKGTSYEEIYQKISYNMLNLVCSIEKPTLKNFYQLRTIEYIKGTDITPYIEEIIKSKINVDEYLKNNWNGYSADVNKNIKIELCGLISDLKMRAERTSNKEFLDICKKIEDTTLEMSDVKTIKKYVVALIKELQISCYAYWEKQKKDPEHCRKIMYKCRDLIFEVKQDSKKSKNTKQTPLSPQDMEKIIEKVNNNKNQGVINNTNEYITEISESDERKVDIRKSNAFPFLGNFEQDNIILIISYTLKNSCSERSIASLYDHLCASEHSAYSRDFIHNIIKKITIKRNIFENNEFLRDRIAGLVNFFYVTGDLEKFCNTNNDALGRIGLENFKISNDEIYKKFVSNPSGENQYFYDEEPRQNSIRRSSELDSMSDEAVVAMSALYSNRMAKLLPKYTMLEYILTKNDTLKKIYDNPELEYEDLGFSDDDICTYMALFKVLQDRIKGYCFKRNSEGNVVYVDYSYEEILDKVKKYKDVYNNYFSDLGANFEEDVCSVMVSVELIEDMYKLKVFSTKSLLYTAIVDKNKNVINWGYVQEENPEDPQKVLLAFDVKTLNMPVFVHVKKSQMIEYLKDLTGDTKLPMYEGAMDMYNYSIKQWIGTSVSYPLSKEQRKIMKDEAKEKKQIKSNVRATPLYKHMKWLQLPNERPTYIREPGTRLYDIANDKIIKNKTNKDKDSTARE